MARVPFLLLAGLALAAAPALPRAQEAAPPPPRLTLDVPTTALTTAGLFLLEGLVVLEKTRLVAPSCRWCEPPQVDRWARGQLLWQDPARAAAASDLLVVVVPVGAALALGAGALQGGGGWHEATEDVLVMAESIAVATLFTEVAKYATARLRPYAWAAGGPPSADARLSFWGGHSALVFSAAASATQVARLRGRPGWRWLGLASFAGAATVSWLRVSGDRHWLTDVVAGAAAGTAAGLGVPLLVLHPADAHAPPVTLVPAPGGLALLF
jgi:membrane-associated phospholipid phosphatase